jgi:uncharacterized protein with PIN domain
MDDIVGKNIRSPMKSIVFKELKQFGDSVFKRICPECKDGIIVMSRDNVTMKLERRCYCFLCGQRYDIVDIKYWKRNYI